MPNSIPLCDRIANKFKSLLSEDTKHKIYMDLVNSGEFDDEIRNLEGSVVEQIDDMIFKMFWLVQFNLLEGMGCSDEEIEHRVYGG